jgi:putative component of membrane protein insertase Oxa1/YidC/SpoIIIJ protein YidD
MKHSAILLLCLGLLLVAPPLSYSEVVDQNREQSNWEPWNYNSKYSSVIQENRSSFSPGSLLFSFLFSTYKTYISPADGSRCPMHPSCSTYSKEAFKTRGIFMATLLTCDRLIRCGSDLDKYEFTLINGKYRRYDPLNLKKP